MGELIPFVRRRGARHAAGAEATFFFDLACPHAYLAAERVDRRFATALWRPAAGSHLAPSQLAAASGEALGAVERRARELHLPLVWPERFPAPVPRAMRAAAYAVARGRGAAFAIAVGRLAFCGGFDVEDPRMLAEAAAAAGLDADGALAAAADERWDRQVASAGRALWVEGGTELPALWREGGVYCGERAVTAAMSWRVAAV